MIYMHLLAALTASNSANETIKAVNDCLINTSEHSDKFVHLQGKTRHGKCRVEQWGHEWKIYAAATYQGRPALLLESLRGKSGNYAPPYDLRWVHLREDHNFTMLLPTGKSDEEILI